MKKKIFYSIILILIVIQFFRIDKTNPKIDISKDFININQPSTEVAADIKSACYDCHSNETVYPWYTNIAPVSWWIKDHINEGRDELNFSEWGNFTFKRKNHKLKKIVEEVNDGDMPLETYTWIHSKSRLSKEQRQNLVDWVKQLKQTIKQ